MQAILRAWIGLRSELLERRRHRPWGKDGVLRGIVPTPKRLRAGGQREEVVATADKGYVWLVSARHPDSTGIWRHPLALDNHAVSGQR